MVISSQVGVRSFPDSCFKLPKPSINRRTAWRIQHPMRPYDAIRADAGAAVGALQKLIPA